jgi:Tfp pilus assembly protein PilO
MKISFAHMNKSTKLLLASTISVLVFFCADTFLFKQFRYGLRVTDAQIKTAQARLLRDLSVQASKPVVKADYESVSPYINQVIVDANDEDVKSVLLRELERLCRESAVTIVSLDTREKSEDSLLYRGYKAAVHLESDFSDFTLFLSKLQESRYLITFDKVALTAQEQSGNTLKIDGIAVIYLPKNVDSTQRPHDTPRKK